MADAQTRGRPRSAGRTAAILEATADLMREVGYEELRVQDVADKAGAGLATIYRRWSTKEELVAAAIEHRPLVDIEPTGDARTDLRRMLVRLAEDVAESGAMLAGFMAAARSHDVLGAAIRAKVDDTIRGELSRLLADLVGSGNPLIPTLADAAPSLLMFRAGMLDEPVDPEAFADEVLALVDRLGS